MATSGEVVFAGTEDGYFKALDAARGEELWHINLGGRIIACPISFLSRERQRVAIAAGNAIYVFGLPE
jgi:alcohol dehydrogenase (cytochrome c)